MKKINKDSADISQTNPPQLSRRKFIQTASVGAALATGVNTSTSSYAKQSNTAVIMNKSHYDVIVVGAGFAGLTSARELRHDGKNVLVLEASNRIGGRTFTSEFAGHKVELGGMEIHWVQPHVWAETKRYHLDIEPAGDGQVNQVVVYTDGKRKEISPPQAFTYLQEAWEKFNEDSRAVFPRPYDPFFQDNYKKYDHISYQDRIDSLNLQEDQASILGGILSMSCSGFTNEASLVEQLRWWSLSGWSFEVLLDTASYQLKDGMNAMIQAMADDGNADIKLNAPVYRVEHNIDRVTITTEDDEIFTADAVVMAIPLPTLKDIEFAPKLSPEKIAASKEGHTGHGTKMFVRVKGQYPGFWAFAPNPNPISLMYTKIVDSDSTIFLCFGPSNDLIDINDDEAVQSAVNKLLSGVNVIESFGYDWNADPFAQGTWCTFKKTQMTKYLAELQKPEGRVFFASSDFASGWRGFIDGAIESGLKTAYEIKRLLG